MGKINQGLLGPVSGKVGNVVGASWRGINYLRMMPANVANPNTPAQQGQRSKFLLILRFILSLLSFIRFGFRNFAIRMSSFNAAMSYNMRNAVEGVAPDYFIAYDKVKVSRGNLMGVPEANAASVEPGKISVSWDDNTGMGNAGADDRAVVVAFTSDLMDTIYNLNAGSRVDGLAEITLPESWTGCTIQVYLTFALPEEDMRSRRDSVSDSLYVGEVILA